MSNSRFDSLKICKHIAFRLLVVFIIWSLFIVRFGLFIRPPGSEGKVFIGDAKPYYFEKSSFIEKKNEYRASEGLWLSLSYVSDVGMAGEVEGSDLDVFESAYIYQVTIDGETIKYYQAMNDYQHILFEKALNDVSAARWRSINRTVCRWVVIWLCLLFVFIASIAYLKKHFGWHFSITVGLNDEDGLIE